MAQAGFGSAFWGQTEPNPQSQPRELQQTWPDVDLWMCRSTQSWTGSLRSTGDVQRDDLKANLLALGLVYTQVNEFQPIYLKLSR